MSNPQRIPVTEGNHSNRIDADSHAEFEDHPLQNLPPLLEERAREFIQAHPLACVAGALALGFAIARAIREVSSE
jgi:hypothetical protein